MISKLKTECGHSFTKKVSSNYSFTKKAARAAHSRCLQLEGMFKDIEMSGDFMSKYQEYSNGLRANSAGTMEAAFKVLTSNNWPTYQHMELKMPLELSSHQASQHRALFFITSVLTKTWCTVQDMFQSYYLRKYNGRRLMWQYSLCQCLLKARFAKVRCTGFFCMVRVPTWMFRVLGRKRIASLPVPRGCVVVVQFLQFYFIFADQRADCHG